MKTQSYHAFWQRIHKSALDKGLPLRVMFELTYRCNFSCRHCYVPLRYRKYKELTTKEVFSIIDLLRDAGCFYLGFTGGEPFVRDDIIDILWYAKNLGFQLIVYTNGSLIDKKQVKELALIRPNKVDITIPAMHKTAFERISGVIGSHDKVFRTIALLHKNGVPLGFKTCVLKENESQIKEIQDFAASLGALHRLDDKLLPRFDGSTKPYKYRGSLKDNLVIRQASGVPLKKSAELCNVELDHHKSSIEHRASSIENIFKCGVGETQAAITPLGELKMCLMIDYPKYKISTEVRSQKTEVRKQGADLMSTWQRLKKLVASIKPDQNYKCARCGLQDYCKWCPAKAWLENRNFTCCDPDSRRWVKSRKLQAKAKV